MLSPRTAARNAPSLDEALAAAIDAYARRNPASAAAYARAVEGMPGGNTRTVLYYAPFPLVMVRGEACRLWDADGHEYIDFLAEYTAALYGHSNATIRAALVEAIGRGINLSAQNALEGELARMLRERFPSLELVRFTNSGTEANMMALAAATAFTRRRKILVFEGGYHGSGLTFAGGGSPANLPYPFVVAPYNDIGATRALLEREAADLAAILVEPMLGAGGCIPGTPEFLAALRAFASANGTVLIFDEVMTSRLSPGGRQQLLGIRPDLTTLGKYLGGGLSFGAFGGRADIMAQFDPRRPHALSHSGTFNNNILTMTAAVTGLRHVLTPEASRAMNARGDRLREALADAFRSAGAPYRATGVGSILGIHADGPAEIAAKLKNLLFFDLIERGLYLAPRGFMALSLPVGNAETDAMLAAVRDILDRREALLESIGALPAG